MRPRIGPPPDRPSRGFRAALRNGLFPECGEPSRFSDYVELVRALLRNRDNLPYAWRILKSGVCADCPLGTGGFHDGVRKGIHLCGRRLAGLRRFTAPPIETRRLLPHLVPGEIPPLSVSEGRLVEPLFREKGASRFQPVSWEEAVQLAAARIRKTDPDRAAWIAPGPRTPLETAYVFQKGARLLGCANVDGGRLSAAGPAFRGLRESFGRSAATCSFRDLIGTDLIVLWGTSLLNRHPEMASILHEAKRRGTRVVVVNPYREPELERVRAAFVPSSACFGSWVMDDYYPVMVGGDIPFINGTLKALRDRDGLRMSFLRHHVAGYEEMVTRLDALNWSELEEASGVPKSEMLRFASIYAQADRAVFVFSSGLTRHPFGRENVRSVATLALARGMVGRKGCGVLPMLSTGGPEEAEGCGVSPEWFPGRVPVSPESARQFEEIWGAPVPGNAGLSLGRVLFGAHRGRIDLLFTIAGDFQELFPPGKYSSEVLDRIDFRIHADISLHPSMLTGGGAVLLLPVATPHETDGGWISASSDRRIRLSPMIVGPSPDGPLPEWKVIAGLAVAADPALAGGFAWRNTADIRREMEDIVPMFSGITELEPDGEGISWGGRLLYENGAFDNMPDGRAALSVETVPDIRIPEGRFLLTTRSQRNVKAGKGASLLMHPEDARELGIGGGDRISAVSDYGRMEGVLRLAPVRRRTVQAFRPSADELLPRPLEPLPRHTGGGVLVQVRRLPVSDGQE